MDAAILENVQLNLSGKRSIEYAKARAAIEMAGKNRSEKRAMKQAVMEHLGCVHVEHKQFKGIVVKELLFSDGSSARF